LLLLNFNIFKIKERAYGCDLISETMLNSLYHGSNSTYKFLFNNTGKVVVINDNDDIPTIVSNIDKTKKNNFKFIDYVQMNIEKKIVNVYECNSDFCDMFLSERNLIIITFKGEDEDKIVMSAIERLLKVVNKNILPVGVLVLGLGEYNLEKIEKISNKFFMSIELLENEVESEINSVLNDYDPLKTSQFHVKMNLSQLMNLRDHLKFIKRIIDFSAMDIDVMYLLYLIYCFITIYKNTIMFHS